MIDTSRLLAAADRVMAGGVANLAALLGAPVALRRPTVVEPGDALPVSTPAYVVRVRFIEGIEGDTALVFGAAEVKVITGLMLAGMPHTEEDLVGELGMSALAEAMNQLVAGVGRSIAEAEGFVVTISPPEVAVTAELPAPAGDDIAVSWEGEVAGQGLRLYWRMPAPVAAELGAVAPVTPPAAPHPGQNGAVLGRLAEVLLDVTVELGRNRLPIRELLSLDEGGVIRLDRPVSEPADLLVNGLPTARGDIVIVDGRLGLRITELVE